ncbi:MAG: hypothetical protein RRB13_15660 [bacterium]|nr:hypothetical protein [bacterium]
MPPFTLLNLALRPDLLEWVAAKHMEAFATYQPPGLTLAAKVGMLPGRLNAQGIVDRKVQTKFELGVISELR